MPMIFHQPENSATGNNYNIFVHKIKHDFHFHRNMELIYIVEGTVECIVNNKKEILSAGDFGLCLPNEIHSYIPAPDASYWACVFSEDLVSTFIPHIKDKTGDTFRFECEKTVRAYVKEKLLNTDSPSLLTLKSCLYAICEQYIKNVNLTNTDKSQQQIMYKIIDYIEKHYTEDIKLSDVSNMLKYDYHYVSRYFNSLFNMSFKNFLTVYRLEKAIDLLTKSDKKMIDIAYESGFQSVRSFNNCFKKHFGTSPVRYKYK